MSLNNSEDNNSNSSFSESLRLFQSIQVLANEEESSALRNETAQSEYIMFIMKHLHTEEQYNIVYFAEVLVEAADYCFSSMMFTSMAGLVTVLFIMSGEKIMTTL